MTNNRALVILVGLTFVTGALVPRVAFAAGEQEGRIRGVVADAVSGQPFPGMTITAKSPALIGEPRRVDSDDKGRFELPALPPGTYTVEFSYPGSTVPLVRTAIVQLGEAATLNVKWSLETLEAEAVSVVSRQQLTRPDSTQTGATRGMDTLNRLPTGRSYQGIAQQVPGVSGGSNPNIKGGFSSSNRYLIDGVDVTDPISGTFTKNLTFDSMSQLEIITGGFDAEYNALGGIINVVTGRGSDDHHAVASLYLNHQKLSASGTYGSNVWEGLQPFNETEAGKNQSYEASIDIGGPILKRKLWYGLTYQYSQTESSIVKGPPLGVPPYGIQHPSRVFVGHLLRGKLSAAPSQKHLITLSANADPASLSNTAQGNSFLGVAETHQNQGGLVATARWQWFATNSLTSETRLGYLGNGLEIGPEADPRLGGSFDAAGCDKFSGINCTWDWNRPRRVNVFDGTTWHQGPNYRTDDRYRVSLDQYLTLRGSGFGYHDAKVGIQSQHVWRRRFQETPGGSVFQDTVPGVGLEAGLCDPTTFVGCDRRIDYASYDVTQKGNGVGFFIQDRWWTPLQWLSVSPGLRIDYGRVVNRNNQPLATLLALGPRLGLTADVTRDGRNVLFGYYGRSTETLPLDVAASIDETVVGVTKTWGWDAMARDYTRKIAETGGDAGVVIDKDVKAPRSDEITFGFRREFLPDTVTAVEYTWKRLNYTWDSVEQNRVWDPSGTRVVGYLDPAKEGLAVFKYTTPYAPRRYQGVILKSEGRPSAKWEYHASHTLSWTLSQNVSSNPRQQRFNTGWSSADLRHYVRLYAAYYLMRDLNMGATFSYLSQAGDTMTKAFYNQQTNSRANFRSPAGTTTTNPNDPNAISEFRLPPLATLNLRLQYNVLPSSTKNRVYLTADIFNVLNSRTPTGVTSSDLPTFGQVGSRQAPRRFQLAVSWMY